MSEHSKAEPFYLIHHAPEHGKVAVMCQSGVEEAARAGLVKPPRKASKKTPITTADPIKSMVHQQQLIIEHAGCQIAEVGPHADEVIDSEGRYAQEYESSMRRYSHGIIGVISIGNSRFLFFITGKQQVATLPGGELVYKITAVDYIPFVQSIDSSKKGLSSETLRYINAVKSIFDREGFYFSYNADLTQSQQRQAQIQAGSKVDFRKTLDTTYQWNHKILQDFTLQSVDDFWTIPIICGYVEQARQTPDHANVDVVVISRRRHAFHGPRFQPCGIDEFSNVSNFVESEVILTGADTVFSYVQVRGGLPIFWDASIHTKKPETRKQDHLTQAIFDDHLKDLTDNYKRVVMLDLLKKKSSEGELVK